MQSARARTCSEHVVGVVFVNGGKYGLFHRVRMTLQQPEDLAGFRVPKSDLQPQQQSVSASQQHCSAIHAGPVSTQTLPSLRAYRAVGRASGNQAAIVGPSYGIDGIHVAATEGKGNLAARASHGGLVGEGVRVREREEEMGK